MRPHCASTAGRFKQHTRHNNNNHNHHNAIEHGPSCMCVCVCISIETHCQVCEGNKSRMIPADDDIRALSRAPSNACPRVLFMCKGSPTLCDQEMSICVLANAFHLVIGFQHAYEHHIVVSSSNLNVHMRHFVSTKR